MKSGLPSTPFFTILMTLFLLVKLAFMTTLTGLWNRLSNNLPLACLSLHPLWKVSGWHQGLVFCWMYKSCLWQILMGTLWQRRPHSDPKMESHPSGRKSSGADASASVTDSKRNESCGGWQSWCFTVCIFIDIIFICCAGWYTSPFLDQWRSITSNSFVLILLKVTISRLGLSLHCSITFTGSTLRLLWLIIQL